MNFVKKTSKTFSPLSLPCRGVTNVDAMPEACNIDKSRNSRNNQLNVSVRARI